MPSIFNIKALAKTSKDGKFIVTNLKHEEKELTIEKFFNKVKANMKKGQRAYIRIHAHVLEQGQTCDCFKIEL